MVNCESAIVFEGRAEKVIKLLELGFLFAFFIHRGLTFWSLLNIKQFFETIIVVLIIKLLIVEHS